MDGHDRLEDVSTGPSSSAPSSPSSSSSRSNFADRRQASADETRKFAIQHCIQSLVHASHCKDDDCSQPSCHKMKNVMAHAKICERKPNGGCTICKQLIVLCCHHAKYCQELQNCLVPFCANIKHKIRLQRLQQSQLLTRQMQMMMMQLHQNESESSTTVPGQPNFTLNLQLLKTQPEKILEMVINNIRQMLTASDFTPPAR